MTRSRKPLSVVSCIAGACALLATLLPVRAAATLTKEEVRAVARFAARALDSQALVVAVVDRNGTVLAVYRKPAAPLLAPGNFPEAPVPGFDPSVDPPVLASADDVAIALARTGAFFSNDQAPLSSRTVRFVSGIHFPPGIFNTSTAALYGIEATNRGCSFATPTSFPIPRALRLGGATCDPLDRSGCGLGILTGKANLFDADPGAVNPGGVPLFKFEVLPSGRKQLRVVGGVGVVVYPYTPGTPLPRAMRLILGQQAEWAAGQGMRALITLQAGGDPDQRIVSCREVVRALPKPGTIFLDGIRLPFVRQCTQPIGTTRDGSTGPFDDASFAVPPSAGATAPDGYLLAPTDGVAVPESLSAAEVGAIVQRCVARADRTRAAIRLPIGSPARFVIAITDRDGKLLGVYRQPDATIFSIDVAVAKARNVTFFSGPERSAADLPGVPFGTAVTNRTLGFGAQPLYPPGIDREARPTPGPWFDQDASLAGLLFAYDASHACSQGSQVANPYQNGIVFFPGSAPLYRHLPGPDGKVGTADDPPPELIGGLGVSGDGVEQDDIVTFAGTAGFEAPEALRADQVKVRGARLPYLKFNRNPFVLR